MLLFIAVVVVAKREVLVRISVECARMTKSVPRSVGFYQHVEKKYVYREVPTGRLESC